ncbi:MAG: hypothetical protein ACXWX3_05910 [Actinomycetota bacterium]
MTTGESGRARICGDLAWLAGLALVVLGMLLAPFIRHDFRFGVGPDIPVYLWWTRVGASQGLALVGERPGSPALFAVLMGATHLPVAAVTAGFEAAFGAAIGAGTAMLVRAAGVMAGERRGARAAWVLGGLLAGSFTVHLAAGYLANLAFAAPFVAASVCLAVGTRRSTVAAAIALGGGGLAHPRFFLIGALVLAAVGVWSLARHERGWESDAGRVAAATVAGGAVVAGGLLAMAIGPARLAVDTSKDGFLRRAGMTDAVRHAYLERSLHRWTRYVQWLALPLAGLALMRTNGFARRVLAAWTALVVIGAPVGLLTGWFPADRLITFGFSIPALAGVGVVAVWLWLASRAWLATLVAATLVGVMAAGALISWSRQEPFISPLEVERATSAAGIADTLGPDIPLVFIVDDTDATVSFLATRAANVLRASMPPDRADDVYVYVGTPHNFLVGEPTLRGSEEYDAMSRIYLGDIPQDPQHPAVGFVLAPFNRTPEAASDPDLFRWSRGVFATVPGPSALGARRDPLEPSSPAQIVLTAFALLALTGAVGFGWARWAGLDVPAAAGVAPAIGVATLAIGGVALEPLGLPLAGSLGPTVVALLAAGAGYLLLVLQGEPLPPPPPPVEEQPAE